MANRISACGVALVCGAGLALVACQPIEQATRSIEDSFAMKVAPPPVILKDEPQLRVRLVKDARTITVDGPTKVVVRTNQGAPPVSITTPLVITSSSRGMTIRDSRGQLKTWGYGTDVEVVGFESGVSNGAGGTLLRVNEVSLPGTIAIRPRWQDYPEQFDVLATMGVESYLPGVVKDEMSANWPRQAVEAQAVASRTFTLGEHEIARRTGKAFDVETTLERQRALGGGDMLQAMEAVRATRGIALMSGGRLLKAYCCSTCGGRPASAVDVWGSTFGSELNRAEPLYAKARAFACDRSPNFRWEVERRDDELSQRIRSWGSQYSSAVSAMTRLREVRVEQSNAAKRPIKYRLIDNGGREFLISADEFRAACNQNVAGLPAITDQNRLRSGDVEVEVWANIVKFRGRGFGHGVGMCQQCARGFADQGWDWRRMMGEFYPGALPTKLY